jgi:ABC-type multidrug transport system fused ATPase/permease subunit
MVFLWDYSSLRQMLWMKINYFYLILRQEQGWFDENNIYEFATKVQAQLEQIEMGIGARFGQLILMFTNLITGFIVGFIVSWKLSLVLLCCFPFIIVGFLIILLCMNKELVLSRRTYEEAGGIAEEILYNIKTVTSFVNFDFEIDRFGNLIDFVDNYNRKKALFSALSLGIMTFGLYFGFTFTLFYASIAIANKKINSNSGKPYSVGDAIKVIYSIISSIFSLGSIAPNIQILKESCIAASDYFTLYERVPKIFISEKNFKPNRETLKGKIEFKNIKFIYPNDITQKPILDNLNLTIEPGKKVAFVGESGCGKSTSVNLIERLYDPVEGQILLDGIDIKDYNLEYLRSLIGYVQQEPILFNESIKNNLIFGREEAIKEIGDPDELIKNACQDVYIKNFIEKSRDKYDYIVGVKGSKLSGGQKQRIAIARAILANPKILILDEATSALDNKSEKEVQKALENISEKNITTIIIAHRLSTIKKADMIFALKGGKVHEQGALEELL